MIVMLLVLLAGALSAWLYWRARRRPDAVLVLLGALALAGLLGDFKRSAPPVAQLPIDPAAPLIDLTSAAGVTVEGDGLSAARWRDLPARPLRWKPPASSALQLDFPRSVPPGGLFTLSARLGGRNDLRLQLLSPEGRLLASAGTRLQWRPERAGDLVLRARLLDARGRVLAEGPVPLRVEAPAPLRVQGRFSAPSFDKRALRLLLESSHALLDWQVALAPGVERRDRPRAPMADADLIVADERWLERHPGERAAFEARVAQGARLLVLAASGAPAHLDKPAPLTIQTLGAGRIGWLHAADWHRHAILDPVPLAQWWQGVLDRLDVTRSEPLVWRVVEPMPLAGQRLEVCAWGARGEVEFPQLRQRLAWQRRLDAADSACVAVWPQHAGWLQVRSNGSATRIYVYGAADWPAWQAGLKREATARYALRTPQRPQARQERIPAWPFAAVFALAMLCLWWREREHNGERPGLNPGDPASSSSGH